MWRKRCLGGKNGEHTVHLACSQCTASSLTVSNPLFAIGLKRKKGGRKERKNDVREGKKEKRLQTQRNRKVSENLCELDEKQGITLSFYLCKCVCVGVSQLQLNL